jgi:hypothetical protein
MAPWWSFATIHVLERATNAWCGEIIMSVSENPLSLTSAWHMIGVQGTIFAAGLCNTSPSRFCRQPLNFFGKYDSNK